VVKEDRPDLGQRTRVFKEDEVTHRAYEVIETVIAGLNQVAKLAQTGCSTAGTGAAGVAAAA
jgi:hypothetical protein